MPNFTHLSLAPC